MGGDAGLGRRLAVPRPRSQPHAQHGARALRRDRRAPAWRAGTGCRARAVPAPAPAPGHGHRAHVPGRQRPHGPGQHADHHGADRPGRRAARDRDGQQLPRLPHPRAPLEGPLGRLRRHPDGRAERDHQRQLLRRATPASRSPSPRTARPSRRAGLPGEWFNSAALAEMVSLTGEAAVAKWIRHPHAAKPGYKPLELYKR